MKDYELTPDEVAMFKSETIDVIIMDGEPFVFYNDNIKNIFTDRVGARNKVLTSLLRTGSFMGTNFNAEQIMSILSFGDYTV